MKNDHTKTIFYLDLKNVHKYGCAKFQPNPSYSSQQTATEGAAEKKTLPSGKKKSATPLGDPVSGRDAPITCLNFLRLTSK